jgi:hypothetical protein
MSILSNIDTIYWISVKRVTEMRNEMSSGMQIPNLEMSIFQDIPMYLHTSPLLATQTYHKILIQLNLTVTIRINFAKNIVEHVPRNILTVSLN